MYCMIWRLCPASDMLEFDFHVLILHLMSSYSCVNNPMHILANYSCDSRTVIIDKTQDLHMIIFTFSISILKLSHELYLHLHMCSLLSLLNMCSLLYLLNMCSLLKCEYLFCNKSLSFFVILRLELHVCIMLTFMFCEINNIYIYIKQSWFSHWLGTSLDSALYDIFLIRQDSSSWLKRSFKIPQHLHG